MTPHSSWCCSIDIFEEQDWQHSVLIGTARQCPIRVWATDFVWSHVGNLKVSCLCRTTIYYFPRRCVNGDLLLSTSTGAFHSHCNPIVLTMTALFTRQKRTTFLQMWQQHCFVTVNEKHKWKKRILKCVPGQFHPRALVWFGVIVSLKLQQLSVCHSVSQTVTWGGTQNTCLCFLLMAGCIRASFSLNLTHCHVCAPWTWN